MAQPSKEKEVQSKLLKHATDFGPTASSFPALQ